MHVAGEDLVAQRESFFGDHQPDADLWAVAPGVARIAPLGDLAVLHVALEVGTRDVVEQQITLQPEEFTEPPLEVRLDRLLVGQEPIERGIESIGVHLLW
jgi:hypothetical protein